MGKKCIAVSLASLVALTALCQDQDKRPEGVKTFVKAVIANDIPQVQLLLRGNPDLVNSRTKSGATAVQAAIYRHYDGMAKLLLAAHPKVDMPLACAAGLAADVKRIVLRDPDSANRLSLDDITPLAMAASFRHPEVLQILLAHGAKVNARTRVDRIAPIHSAAFGRDLRCVRVLVEHGADVNMAQPGNFTALDEAASNGDLDIVKYLVAHGADVGIMTEASPRGAPKGQTARSLAATNGRTEVVEFLDSLRHPSQVRAMTLGRPVSLMPSRLVTNQAFVTKPNLSEFFDRFLDRALRFSDSFL